MLTQKLNVDDLQFEKGTFDGTMAYAQNKVKEADANGTEMIVIVAHVHVC